MQRSQVPAVAPAIEVEPVGHAVVLSEPLHENPAGHAAHRRFRVALGDRVWYSLGLPQAVWVVHCEAVPPRLKLPEAQALQFLFCR